MDVSYEIWLQHPHNELPLVGGEMLQFPRNAELTCKPKGLPCIHILNSGMAVPERLVFDRWAKYGGGNVTRRDPSGIQFVTTTHPSLRNVLYTRNPLLIVISVAKAIEVYLARSLGFGFLTLAILTMMLTGSIPLTTTIAAPVSAEESDPKAPYALPTLVVTSLFQGVSAFYAYTWFVSGAQSAFAVDVGVHSALAAVGLWCILFASGDGKISRSTGADKRTTGFPFANSEAAKKKQHADKKST